MKYLFTLLIAVLGIHSFAQTPALRFDGVNDYVNLGTEVATDVRTIEFWFKLDEDITPALATHISLVVRDNTTSNYDEIVLNFDPSGTAHPGKIRFGVVKTWVDYSDIFTNNDHWNADQWYHIAAVVHPALGMMLFVDGIKQDDTHPNTIPPPALDKITTIGCWGELNNRFFDGTIDDVRFSSEGLYTEDFIPPCPDLPYEGSTIALWHLNEAIGSLAHDSGLTHDADIEGASWGFGPICCTSSENTMPPIFLCRGQSAEVFGDYVTEEGTYIDSLINIGGCDSIVYQEVYVSDDVIDDGISITGDLFTADQAGATYQWMNCNTGEIIPGEINQFYEPTDNEPYAVIITIDGCIDTSACITIQQSGIKVNSLLDFKIYPNPADHLVTISVNNFTSPIQLTIFDLTGKRIYSEQMNTEKLELNTSNFVASIYLVKLLTAKGSMQVFKLYVQH
ncbi:MAG: T9SS type A sorting domain-containing protein [Crocinitomix sp.]|nr:T9SS type A sorting domain-containing protein [Crocinitomix sp.]